MNRKLMKDCFSDISRYKLTFVVNFLLVSFLVFLLCYLVFIIVNINNLEKKSLEKNQLILFLNDKANADEFIKHIQDRVDISSVELIDNKYLNELIKKSFPNNQMVSASEYNVKILRVETNLKNIDSYKEEFLKDTSVDEVIFNSEWSKTFLNTLSIIRVASFIFFAFLVFLGSILFFYSYALFSSEREREIQILKYLGASRSYIMLPYLLSSFSTAILGAILGFFLYISSVSMLLVSIKTFLSSWSNYFYLINLSKIHFVYIFVLISFSVLLSSFISLLKVVNEDT